jgi:hypothetical protein
MDKQPEPRNQKSKRMETNELTLEKNTQKENDHNSENSNIQQKGVQQENLTDSPVMTDTRIEELYQQVQIGPKKSKFSH